MSSRLDRDTRLTTEEKAQIKHHAIHTITWVGHRTIGLSHFTLTLILVANESGQQLQTNRLQGGQSNGVREGYEKSHEPIYRD